MMSIGKSHNCLKLCLWFSGNHVGGCGRVSLIYSFTSSKVTPALIDLTEINEEQNQEYNWGASGTTLRLSYLVSAQRNHEGDKRASGPDNKNKVETVL